MNNDESDNVRLSTEIVENADGKFMILSNDALGNHLKRGDRWEPHFTKVVENTVPKGSVAIDVGANLGANTVVLAKAVGARGLVIAAEPLRVIFQQLCGNCFLNGLANVMTMNLAFGAERGVVQMNPVNYFATRWNFGDSRLGQGGEQVEMMRLDDLNPRNVSFIKMDAQGAELDILKGAQQTLASNRPVMFVEIEEAQLNHRGVTAQNLIDYIRSLGYILIHFRNDYPTDYLCLPAERRGELQKYLGLIDCPTAVIE